MLSSGFRKSFPVHFWKNWFNNVSQSKKNSHNLLSKAKPFHAQTDRRGAALATMNKKTMNYSKPNSFENLKTSATSCQNIFVLFSLTRTATMSRTVYNCYDCFAHTSITTLTVPDLFDQTTGAWNRWPWESERSNYKRLSPTTVPKKLTFCSSVETAWTWWMFGCLKDATNKTHLFGLCQLVYTIQKIPITKPMHLLKGDQLVLGDERCMHANPKECQKNLNFRWQEQNSLKNWTEQEITLEKNCNGEALKSLQDKVDI